MLRVSLFVILSASLSGACPYGDLQGSGAFYEWGELVSELVQNPESNSAIGQQLVSINRFEGNGVAVLDTQAFFPESLMQRLSSRFSEDSTAIVISTSPHFIEGSILSEDQRGQSLSVDELKPFKAYAQWLTKHINAALSPDEQVVLKSGDLRVTRSDYDAHGFRDWHQDGFYLAAAVALRGEGTEYVTLSPRGVIDDNTLNQQVSSLAQEKTPTGNTLVFSALNRTLRFPSVAATAHRSPSSVGERLFLILRFSHP